MATRCVLWATVLLGACAGGQASPRTSMEAMARSAPEDDGRANSLHADAGAHAAGDAAGASGEAARLYREAQAAAEAGDFTLAARRFSEAYGDVPSLEMAFNAFRMCERSAAVMDAERWYAAVLSHDPPAALRVDLDQRMASLRDFARRREEDIARAPPDASQLVREAAVFFARGVALYQRRRFRPALAAFEAALRYSQDSQREFAELYYNLAVTHERLGNRAEAAAAFREFLARRPDTPERAALEARARALSQ